MKASSDQLKRLNAGAERNKIVDRRSEDMVTPDIEQIALNDEMIGLPLDKKSSSKQGIIAREARNKRLSKSSKGPPIILEANDIVGEQLLNINKLHNLANHNSPSKGSISKSFFGANRENSDYSDRLEPPPSDKSGARGKTDRLSVHQRLFGNKSLRLKTKGMYPDGNGEGLEKQLSQNLSRSSKRSKASKPGLGVKK